MRNSNILISGAGVAGPTLAYWLRQFGFNPTLVERAPVFRTGGYLIDFWGVGYDVAERMDLLVDLHRDGEQVREVRVVNAAGQTTVTLDAQRLLPSSGGRYVNILRGDLAYRVWQRVEHDVETLFGESVTRVEQDASGVTVSFERAAPRRFDLVIGADGLHSRVRQLVFGEAECTVKHLGYGTAAFSVPNYGVRNDGAYVSFAAPGRQVARYSLRDGRTVFFLLFACDAPRAAPFGARPGSMTRDALRNVFRGAGWECDAVLDAMDRTDDVYADAVAQIRMNTWWRGRVALLGDAAFCPSLLSGQGSALAMAGAYLLARSLAEASGCHETAFEQYQRTFKPFVDRKQRAAARYGPWFAPRTRFGVRVRNAAMRLMQVPAVSAYVAASSFRDDFRLPE